MTTQSARSSSQSRRCIAHRDVRIALWPAASAVLLMARGEDASRNRGAARRAVDSSAIRSPATIQGLHGAEARGAAAPTLSSRYFDACYEQ